MGTVDITGSGSSTGFRGYYRNTDVMVQNLTEEAAICKMMRGQV
jgi:hypothetical protein